MSISPLMGIGLSGMTAAYAALQTTGQNIANANVAGYSRQQVQLTTVPGQYTGAGFFGRGVDVSSVTRAYDVFATGQAAVAQSLSSMDAARLSQLQQLQQSFPTGDAGLGNAANALFNAMSDVANNPGDLAARRVVLARASDLAAQFSSAGAALDTLQSGVSAQLQTSVAHINTLAQSIAAANKQIVAAQATGQPPNDLLDQRDRLIASLSQEVQVSRITQSDGSVAVFIGGGQNVVLGTQAAQLRVVQDSADPTRSAVGIADGGITRVIDGSALGGGTLAGLLGFQNSDLVAGRNLIGQLAASVAGAVNLQQSHGLTLQPPLGQGIGAAMFAVGAPQALPNAANAVDATGTPIGSVTLSVADASALQASEYDLRASPNTPGAWQLTRLSDGMVSTVHSGDTVDGMVITLNNAQPGDRFLLQPVARAANTMASLLGDPRDIAAASPLQASTAAANTGTAGVAALQINAAPPPVPGATAQISFTDDNGGYSWQLLDAANAVVASGNGVWQAGQPIPAPPQDINGFSLELSGVPKNGDLVSVAPTPASAVASNNGNAIALGALGGAAVSNGHTATDTWAQALAEVGVRVQGAQTAATLSSSAADQAEQQRSAGAGVNLDEEAARLIQYQQSYQAAAKVLQVAQSLFDTLLQTAAAA